MLAFKSIVFDNGQSLYLNVFAELERNILSTYLLQVLEEADRSLHDALCVIRCLVKKRFLIPGGGAPESELSVKLTQFAQTLKGMDAYCFRLGLFSSFIYISFSPFLIFLSVKYCWFHKDWCGFVEFWSVFIISFCRAFAEALEVIPGILAENAGLSPISTVTELRNRHARGETHAGINVRKVSFILFSFSSLS